MSYRVGRDGQLRHLINGAWVTGTGPELSSTNPADPSEVIATYRRADETMIDISIAAAMEARAAWNEIGLLARGRILRDAAGVLADRADDIASLMTAEEGKTLAESRGEVEASVETLHYHAAQARTATGSTFASSHMDEWIRTVRVPLGAVGVITPWNFPVQIPIWKIAPALLWGNTVVWKPASETPAVSVALAEVFDDAGLPPGVLGLILTSGQVASNIVADERVAAVTFTGSVPVGRSIATTLAARGAKTQLELGGHNAAIVLPDIDPASAAPVLTAGAMGSTGQKCTATRRIIAVGPAYDRVVETVAKAVEQLRVGNGADPETDIGPLVSASARSEVEAALAAAIDEGAEVVATAAPGDVPGHLLAPTVLTGPPSLSICRQEVFGPITTILAADDLDHAIELANGTRFGLTASVFSSDERSIRRCVMEVDAGLVKANAATTGSELHVPFGGLKDSTFPGPREQNATSSAEFFTSTKSAYLRLASDGART